MMVAVAFKPRTDVRTCYRRVATIEAELEEFKRRYATHGQDADYPWDESHGYRQSSLREIGFQIMAGALQPT
jgi:hypothetical protein